MIDRRRAEHFPKHYGATLDEFGRGKRADYACDPSETRGRLVLEPESPTRTAFQRDRDRIIHSTAFRRLKHKTQVFVYHESDHFRTRLTHTIEVAQIARSLARALHLDEDLAEALALVHDFGHTPFGHAGERALDDAMGAFGGFDHNAQSLRIVTALERCYAEFDGLNLTWETLEGLVKHNGPLIGGSGHHPLPPAVAEYNALNDLELGSFASLEAQVAAIADDIAYNTHDIDDGLRAGLFALDDMRDVALAGDIHRRVKAKYPALDASRTAHEFTRRQITSMVEDVIGVAKKNITAANPQSVEDVRALDHAIVAFSPEMQQADKEIKAFLFANMYRHKHVMRIMGDAESVVGDLFDAYFNGKAALPEPWNKELQSADEVGRARLVADFIAGQTDRYAIEDHRRLFDATPELR